MTLKLYNSLSRKVEEFHSIKPGKAGMYTCGPTVYHYPTIGNWRTYVLSDFLARTLRRFGYSVDFIMNITDVGHLTGDNEGDADRGEDRLERGARREGKTAFEIAKIYTDDFLASYKRLNLTKPRLFAHATDNIDEQIKLVAALEKKGIAYKTADGDGIYFDTKGFEELTGKSYGELSDIDKRKTGARTWVSPAKRNPADFALWKFTPSGVRRHMEWESPWGVGFPGWHVECSAMAMKYLGESFDIHVGGEDLKQVHHTNEIAQSEAVTGRRFVNYWVHGAFLLVDGGRMGKSVGNAYTLHDIRKKGFEPLALRYLYLTAHYRDPLNFTWESLEAARNSLNNLRKLFAAFAKGRESISAEKLSKVDSFRARFDGALADDLAAPRALAVAWEAAKSNIPNHDKRDLLLSFDAVLGLELASVTSDKAQVTTRIKKLINKREKLRKEGNYKEADKLREELKQLGWEVQDKPAVQNEKS